MRELGSKEGKRSGKGEKGRESMKMERDGR